MKRKFLSLFLIAFLIVSQFVVFQFIPSVYAQSWLTGWSYRKSHTINYASGAGTNYQIKIIVHYGSGTDNGADVYLNSHCRTDFGDVRFTDDDGTTLLDYWMESKVDSNNAVFWVEVADDLSTANATIYVYYGKSDATTTSNGTATFPFFDDFNDNDISDWTIVSGTWTVASGIVSEDTNVQARMKKAFNDSGGFAYEIKIRGTEQGNWAWAGLQIKSPNQEYGKEDQGYVILMSTPTDNVVRILRADAGTVTLLASTTYTFQLNTWYKLKVTYFNNTIKTYINDSYVTSASDSTYTTGEVLRVRNNDVGLRHDFDDVRIRKFVDPEPAHGSWGSEETADTTPPTYSNVGTNTTQAGQPCKFSVLWNDNVNVSGFIFGTNNTGTWQNDTWVAFTVFYNSTAAWSNVTKTLNATVHITVAWRVWCNDTSNNWGSTGIQALTTTQLVTSQLTQTVQPTHSTYRTVSNIRQLTQQSTLSTSMLRIEALTRVFLQSIITLAQTLRNTILARDSVQPTQTKTTTLKALHYPRTEIQAATLSTQTLRLNVLQRTAFQQTPALTSLLRGLTQQRLSLQPTALSLYLVRGLTQTRQTFQPSQTSSLTLRVLSQSRLATQATSMATSTLKLLLTLRTSTQPLNALTQSLRQTALQRVSMHPAGLTTLTTRITAIQRQLSQIATTSTSILRTLQLPRTTTQPLRQTINVESFKAAQRTQSQLITLASSPLRTTIYTRQLPTTFSILHQILTVITPYNVRIVIQSITAQVEVLRLTTLNRAILTSTALTAQTFKIKTLLRITTQPIQTLTVLIRRYTAIRISLQPLQVFFTSIRLQTLTRTVMHLATLRTALISAITPAIPPPTPPAPFVPPPPIIPPPQLYALIVHVIDLFGQNAPGLTVKIIDEKGNLVATLTTGAEGTTDPVQLAKGTYTINVYKDNIFQLSQTITLTEPTTVKIQIGIPVTLTFPVLLALTLIGLAITLAIVVVITRRRR